MSKGFKFLVVADESPEFPTALTFAALRARATRGGLVMLAVIEPIEAAGWSSVEAEMRREATEEAQALTQRFAAEAFAEAGVQAEIIIVEAEVRAALKDLLERDHDIRYLVLASGSGSAGPGPLVASIAKGQSFGGRPVPIVVVPGGMTKPELRALAAPVEEGEFP